MARNGGSGWHNGDGWVREAVAKGAADRRKVVEDDLVVACLLKGKKKDARRATDTAHRAEENPTEDHHQPTVSAALSSY